MPKKRQRDSGVAGRPSPVVAAAQAIAHSGGTYDLTPDEMAFVRAVRAYGQKVGRTPTISEMLWVLTNELGYSKSGELVQTSARTSSATAEVARLRRELAEEKRRYAVLEEANDGMARLLDEADIG